MPDWLDTNECDYGLLRKAFSLWQYRDEIVWKPRCTEWVLNNLPCQPREIDSLIFRHLERNGRVYKRIEHNPDFCEEAWYGMTLEVFGKKVFVKVVFADDCESDPRVAVVSVHYSGNS